MDTVVSQVDHGPKVVLVLIDRIQCAEFPDDFIHVHVPNVAPEQFVDGGVKVFLGFDASFHPAPGVLRLSANDQRNAVVFARPDGREGIVQQRPPVDRRVESASQERVGNFVLYLHQILPGKRPKCRRDILGTADTGRLGDDDPLVLFTDSQL